MTEEKEEHAINLYMIFVENGEDWYIGLMSVPSGTPLDVANAYAEKRIAEDPDYPPGVKLRAAVPFDMVSDAVTEFYEKLETIGVKEGVSH